MTRKVVGGDWSGRATSQQGDEIERASDCFRNALKDEKSRLEALDPAECNIATILPPLNTTNSSTRLINCSLLIRGPADLPALHNHSIVIQDGVIQDILSTSNLPPTFKKLPTTHVPVLMPGLWDCHIHLLGAKTFNYSEILLTNPVLASARLTKSLASLLEAGVTSIRDLGSHALSIRPAVEEGTIPGPHIYSAGAALSQTAGHGDVFDLPYGFVQSRLGVTDTTSNNLDPGAIPLVICDGTTEVIKAVRLQIRRGANLIKVFASGGVLSIADDPLRQQFSDSELSIIVSEANRHGRIVAAHVHGKMGILAALRAGVSTIEHGTYLDEECIDLALEKKVVYVPTRTIVHVGIDHPELMSPESYVKMQECAKHHLYAYKLAVKRGLKIALGTDTGVSGVSEDFPLALGQSGQELIYAVQDAGMSEAQAIEAATVHGPDTLGELGMKPKTGRVEVGYDADLIALKENPLKNIEVFLKKDGVTHVWKSGKVMKEPPKTGFLKG